MCEGRWLYYAWFEHFLDETFNFCLLDMRVSIWMYTDGVSTFFKHYGMAMCSVRWKVIKGVKDVGVKAQGMRKERGDNHGGLFF